MISSGSKKPRRDAKKSEFRNRVLTAMLFFILFSMYLLWSRSAAPDTTPVTQSNQDFHHHVAPSEEHHPYETIQSSLYHSKPSVQDTATDPNSVPVVHKDSGSPIFPPGVRNYHCPLHSSLTLHPLHQHHDNRHRSFYIQVAYIGEEKKKFTTFSDVMTKPITPAPLSNRDSASITSTSTTASVVTASGDGASGNIVIGMAQDTDPKNLVTFCASLRKHSQADVVLFMNLPISERNHEIVKKYSIRVIPFSLSDFSAEFQAYHPSTLRWVMMDKFFEADENTNKYTHVWMIDVRDSMFQADPFAMIAHEKSAFYTFKGVEDKTITQCGWNGGWIKDCFGQVKLNQVGHNNIICSGVSVGTIDVVLKYLNTMRRIVEGKSSEAKFPSCERNGVDQGIHNVLVHTKQIENLVIFNQASSPVLNLQARIANVDEQSGIVKNKAGKLAAVVHQYDRFPALQKTLFQQYAYWIDFSDAMFEWNADAECRRFEYVKDVDMFRGICDYKIKGGMTGPNSCCSICTGLPDCSSFTFYQGQCFLKKGCEGKTKNKGGHHLSGAVSAYYK